MCCEVDPNTGIVIGRGYNLSGKKWLYHPVTGKMLIGIQIPNWDRVIKMVTEAAKMFPNQGHVAWDIGVSESAVAIIEGNDGGNFDLPQVCMQCGLKQLYKSAIKKQMNKQS